MWVTVFFSRRCNFPSPSPRFLDRPWSPPLYKTCTFCRVTPAASGKAGNALAVTKLSQGFCCALQVLQCCAALVDCTAFLQAPSSCIFCGSWAEQSSIALTQTVLPGISQLAALPHLRTRTSCQVRVSQQCTSNPVTCKHNYSLLSISFISDRDGKGLKWSMLHSRRGGMLLAGEGKGHLPNHLCQT